MKRTIPLFITAIFGIAIALALFIPDGQKWGERVATWFDILASIAFILGGGNLLKMHLKKVSDRAAGWGYSVVTILSFLAMLTVGLGKISVPPAADQEFYGQVFAPLALEDLPDSQVFAVAGTIPERADGEKIPPSARRQLFEEDGQVKFRGWMKSNQKEDLLDYEDELEWRCLVETLFEEAQPPGELKGKVFYHTNHGAVAVAGFMEDATRDRLLEIGDNPAWNVAVQTLYEKSRYETRVPVEELPASADSDSFPPDVRYDGAAGELVVKGPMSASQKSAVAGQFPVVRPLDDAARENLLDEIQQRGVSLNEEQTNEFNKAIDGLWSVEQLVGMLNDAGLAREVDKTACEMLEEQKQGVTEIDPKKIAGPDVTLNDEQRAAIEQFAGQPDIRVDQLQENLEQAGDFNPAQQAALAKFFGQLPSRAEFHRILWGKLLDPENPLSEEQTAFLTADYRLQRQWEKIADLLYEQAHRAKYNWSGNYRAQGSPFWWLYEYAFKPLTATMFAMLAFYVASAAFRAFRAKNVEAVLLLGTAFIILLGRTFAGVWLTSWVPETFSGLRIEELSVYIMQVFNTAGNRAIMIGIALGIASTSLKILLGIDRSYLGSAED